jgi:glutaredoxin-related protein
MKANASSDPAANSNRKIFDPRKLAPAVVEQLTAYHAEIVSTVEQAVQSQPVVVVGMAQNVFVKRTRRALEQAGVAFTYLEYGSYFGKWKERLAIKLWTGWPTFPQVFVNGVLIGGHSLTVKALADGSLQRMLAPSASNAHEIQA